VVINRVLLRRSWFLHHTSVTHFLHLRQETVRRKDILEHPCKFSIVSPVPGNQLDYDPPRPNNLLKSAALLDSEEGEDSSALSTEDMIVKHGLLSALFGRRTFSRGSGGSRMGCSFVEAPLGGMIMVQDRERTKEIQSCEELDRWRNSKCRA
jgi:hypothetical protein